LTVSYSAVVGLLPALGAGIVKLQFILRNQRTKATPETEASTAKLGGFAVLRMAGISSGLYRFPGKLHGLRQRITSSPATTYRRRYVAHSKQITWDVSLISPGYWYVSNVRQ
jgi:hypothetical protein